MKKILLASLVTLSSVGIASAEFVYGPQLTVAGDKAYNLTSTASTQTLKQFSFPQLTELKTLELSSETYPSVQVFETGVTVSTYEFTQSESTPDEVTSQVKASLKNKIREADEENIVVYTEKITTKSYDTNLTEVGTLVTSNSYTYTFVDPKEVSEDEVASGAVDIKKGDKKCKNPARKKGGKVCAKVTL